MGVLTPGWVVLPDTPDRHRLGARLPFAWPQVVPHPSGRPWLVGHWAPEELTLASAGPVRVAVIGSGPVTSAWLTRLIDTARTVADLDAVAEVLPGSAHLVAAVGDQIRVQGSLTGLRRVFHTEIDGTAVAGDRADTLAQLTGAGVDEQALAVRVTCGLAPPPLSEFSLWRGVRALPPDCYLRLGPTGPASQVRWWEPPEPELTLAEGAGRLREALASAVALRGPHRGRLGSDLSGGMDSTSLCCLAARATPDLVTVRWAEAEAGNDDAVHAEAARHALTMAEHLVLAQHEIPEVFAGPHVAADTEAPVAFARTLARHRHTARALAATGVRRHLAGHGGDELFSALPGYLHRLLRTRPLTALHHLRGYHALYRWSPLGTLAGLSRVPDLPTWWQIQADQLTAPPPARRTPPLRWGLPLLSLNVYKRQAYRQLVGWYARAGVRLELPFVDDRVVETVLAVRQHERTTPWRYKPLLAEAMHGTVPDLVLCRTTKGEFGEDVRIGLRRHLPAVLELFADSALAGLGLIDPDRLRERLHEPQADNTTVIAMENLLGCETWLRAAADVAPVAEGRTDEPAVAS